jgi:hypothetical protein
MVGRTVILRIGLTGFLVTVAGVHHAPRPGWLMIVTIGAGFLLTAAWPSLVAFGARLAAERPRVPRPVPSGRGSPFDAQRPAEPVSPASLMTRAEQEIDSRVTKWRSVHRTFHKTRRHPRCPWCQALS